MEITEALAQLDPLDDDVWTQDGAPKTEAVSELVGTKVTRQMILNAAPKFTRSNMDIDVSEEPAEEPAAEEPVVEESAPDMGLLHKLESMEPALQKDFVREILEVADKENLSAVEDFLVKQIQVLDEKQTDLEEMRRRTKANLAITRTWIKTLMPDMSNQEAIKTYIRASQERRAEKAGLLQEALGGIKVSDLVKLDPRAAIDRAFARKTGRGGQRPTR